MPCYYRQTLLHADSLIPVCTKPLPRKGWHGSFSKQWYAQSLYVKLRIIHKVAT